jgi:cell wall-associated NlpC family hydrolase
LGRHSRLPSTGTLVGVTLVVTVALSAGLVSAVTLTAPKLTISGSGVGDSASGDAYIVPPGTPAPSLTETPPIQTQKQQIAKARAQPEVAQTVPRSVSTSSPRGTAETTTTRKPTPTPTPTPTPNRQAAPAPTTRLPGAVVAAPKPKPLPVSPVKPQPVVIPNSGSVQANVIAAARSFLGAGIPYLFGGKTVAGADCSGFVWLVLKRAGYAVPYRSSAGLRSWATPIGASQAVPGDLVLFPGHAGIYAGGGMLIDQGGPGRGPILRPIWTSAVTYGRMPL